MSEESSRPMRFYATYPFDIDAKKRLQIPSKWRPIAEVIGGKKMAIMEIEFMLTLTRVGQDGCACITAMPAEVFEQYAQKVVGLPLLDPNAEKLRRFLGSRSEPVMMDGAGRITLPTWMMDKVGILQKSASDKAAGKVVLQGEVDRFSIWSASKYEAYEKSLNQQDENEIEYSI